MRAYVRGCVCGGLDDGGSSVQRGQGEKSCMVRVGWVVSGGGRGGFQLVGGRVEGRGGV